MDIGSIIYDLYTFWVNNFNLRRKDDNELYEWLHEQIKYKNQDGKVCLQINNYEGEVCDDTDE